MMDGGFVACTGTVFLEKSVLTHFTLKKVFGKGGFSTKPMVFSERPLPTRISRQ